MVVVVVVVVSERMAASRAASDIRWVDCWASFYQLDQCTDKMLGMNAGSRWWLSSLHRHRAGKPGGV